MMLRYILILLLCVPRILLAEDSKMDSGMYLLHAGLEQPKSSLEYRKPFVLAESQLMISTHSTYFKGVNVVFGYQFSNFFSLGLGTEYSYCPFHNDNNWNLSHLKFLPIFINTRFNLSENKKLMPFFVTSEGISFVHYKKEELSPKKAPYMVSERGIYFYSGFGLSYKINRKLTVIVDMGYMGFHMSFHNMDVNPHGYTVNLGLKI
jgi:hypothetical protein